MTHMQRQPGWPTNILSGWNKNGIGCSMDYQHGEKWSGNETMCDKYIPHTHLDGQNGSEH